MSVISRFFQIVNRVVQKWLEGTRLQVLLILDVSDRLQFAFFNLIPFMSPFDYVLLTMAY